jgi:hypothetical protein
VKASKGCLGKHVPHKTVGLTDTPTASTFEPIVHQTQGDFSDPHLEMNIRFFNAGFTGLASWWLEKGKPIPIEQASLQFTRDILPGYLRLMSN